MPFGLEQNTGVGNLDFAYRALGSTALAPGRDRGVMVFGDLGRVNYEAGVFDDDGDIAESNEPQFVAEGEDLEVGRTVVRGPASPAICSACCRSAACKAPTSALPIRIRKCPKA